MTGAISIGTSGDGYIVICNSSDSSSGTVMTGITPASARIYAAMMMALADLLDPPASDQSGGGA